MKAVNYAAKAMGIRKIFWRYNILNVNYLIFISILR